VPSSAWVEHTKNVTTPATHYHITEFLGAQ